MSDGLEELRKETEEFTQEMVQIRKASRTSKKLSIASLVISAIVLILRIILLFD